MIQLPVPPPRADSLQTEVRINWNQLLQGEALARSLSRVVVVLLVAFISYRLIKIVVRKIVAHQDDADDPIIKRLREQRAQTLGSLLQNVALVVIITLAALTILGTFMPIGPLLAGVSVVGLAVSFGAQSLVKDVITGTFILLEGQYGIGDVVRIGDVSGQVERLTLRTTSLRDGEGTVHVIPNGEIKMVSNLTKTWSRAVLDIFVDYREDVDRIMEELRSIGDKFHRDREWAPLLLGEPEVLGVSSLSAIGVQITFQVKTLPLKQWQVARELRRRIKKRFDEQGIAVPLPPHVTFQSGDRHERAESSPPPPKRKT